VTYSSAAYLAGRRQYSRPQAMLWSENSGTLMDGAYVPTGYEVGADYPAGTSASSIDQFLVLSDDNRSPISFTPNRLELRERMINGRMRSHHIADKLSISLSWNMLPSRSHHLTQEFIADAIMPISSVSSNGTSVTYTATAHPFSTNDYVIISGISGSGSSGYNGTFKITSITTDTFTVANTTTGGTLSFTSAEAQHLYLGKSSRLISGGKYYRNNNLQYTTDGGAGGVELLDWYEKHTGPFWVFLSYDKYTNFDAAGGTDDAAMAHLTQYSQVIQMYITSFNYSVEKRGGTNYDFWNISVTLEEA
jgi:hypothetical protein